jgi:hypothetical protein
VKPIVAAMFVVLLSEFSPSVRAQTLWDASRRAGSEIVLSHDADKPGRHWDTVLRLKHGAPIVITVAEGPPVTRRFVSADAESIRVVDLGNPTLSETAARDLLDLVTHHSDYLPLIHSSGGIRHKSLTLSLAGLSVDGQRIASVDEVLVPIPRSAVVEIVTQPVQRGSTAGAVLGAAAGGAVGFVTALHILLSDTPCGGCEGRTAAGYSVLIGFPVLGGALGYQVSHRTVSHVIYRP